MQNISSNKQKVPWQFEEHIPNGSSDKPWLYSELPTWVSVKDELSRYHVGNSNLRLTSMDGWLVVGEARRNDTIWF